MECPDKIILSVYYDGKLPTQYRAPLEKHIKTCPRCTAILARYGEVSDSCALSDEENSAVTEVQNRLYNKLNLSMLEGGGREGQSERVTRRGRGVAARSFPRRLLSRRLYVPLPFAAAAALLVVFFAVIAVFRPKNAPREEIAVLPVAPVSSEVMLPAGSSINEILNYLKNDNESDIMIIPPYYLPASGNFRYGEPLMFIKESGK